MLLVLSHASFFIAWAKPVPVNPALFKDPRRDEIRVSLAGPLSNLLMAIVFLIVGIIFRFPLPMEPDAGGFGASLFQLCYYGISINLLLAFFNLIPIFPLDGSHILENLLPLEFAYKYRSLRQYGFIILLILIMTPILNLFLSPAWFLRDVFLQVWIYFY